MTCEIAHKTFAVRSPLPSGLNRQQIVRRVSQADVSVPLGAVEETILVIEIVVAEAVDRFRNLLRT